MSTSKKLQEELKLIHTDALRDLESWQKYERAMKDKYREEGGILNAESAVSSKMLKILCIVGAVFTAVNLLIHYLL